MTLQLMESRAIIWVVAIRHGAKYIWKYLSLKYFGKYMYHYSSKCCLLILLPPTSSPSLPYLMQSREGSTSKLS